jgi:hypothetical protein
VFDVMSPWRLSQAMVAGLVMDLPISALPSPRAYPDRRTTFCHPGMIGAALGTVLGPVGTPDLLPETRRLPDTAVPCSGASLR